VSRPIADYALLSDCQGAALVSREGSIDWACLPRFDSPAVFARLLGEDAGRWRIAPRGESRTERAYLADTMVLRSQFHTPDGAVVAVIDALVFGPDERGHRIGRHSPHVIVRRVEGIVGTVEMEVELAARAGYGLTEPVLVAEVGGVRSRGGPYAYVVSSEVALQVGGSDASATVSVSEGEAFHVALLVASPWEDSPAFLTGDDMAGLLDATTAGWRSWSALHQGYDGPYAGMVRHSGRVLQALTYAPTGAAATTSLPETVGGARNWDYRFCWVRDASLTLEALWVAACPDEAGDFFAFLATAAGGRIRAEKDLQILYGVGGERLVPEHELAHLAGYRHSAPVRIGNGAWDQRQLDVYGELLSAAWVLASEVGKFDPLTAQFLIDVADTAAARWTEPDQGIWEMRGEPRHFVYSKLMCWVALDRAARLAPMLGAEDRVEAWTATRDQIREAVETDGWSEPAGAYAQSFASDDLDASNLMLLLTGFLPATDPRMRATVEAVDSRLTDQRGFVYRYRSSDGLGGEEGTFVVCTFWLVQCLAEMGELTWARQLFERVAGVANEVGLISEEIDPATGELLGNFPQAFTHIGLVNAAWAIARAEGAASGETGPLPSPPPVTPGGPGRAHSRGSDRRRSGFPSTLNA
jgi:GH15 family glucan-1,4-alpha-glucosidase